MVIATLRVMTGGTAVAVVAPGMRTFSQRGVTLIELMVVVAIIGVLAGIAVFMFGKSASKAKANEVHVLFTELKLRQEAFAVEHDSRYLSTGTADDDYWPGAPSGSKVPTTLAPMPTAWSQLKMAPDRTEVYCGYVTIAGLGGDPANIGATATAFGMTAAPARNWYYVIAECDFDNDATVNSLYFSRSDQDGFQVKNEGK